MATPGSRSSTMYGLLLLGFIATFHVTPATAAEKPPGQGLQCDGCVAILQELHPKLSASQGRKRLVDGALKGLCNADNFVVYRHSPPKMLKACNFILDNYRDELTSSLHNFYKKYKVKDNLKLQAEFCDETIKVCPPGMRDTDIRMNPVGMSIDEANEKLAEGFDLKQETVIEGDNKWDEL
ncbi:uncharacterized protein [Dermacentor andersoni]|uniref:uncharacterized protein n=1 Tax=Dermacentor andersoni TaxID=34620 RepID=UPI002155908E|nr:uncharacterized protein LOC126525662 [Dermacentor andersoni]